MLFVIDKPHFQSVLSIVRDDRTKDSQWLAGPFLRIEANEDYVKMAGLEVSAKIPATVYEPGVLFLKVTLFRKLLQTLKRLKFLTIQVTADELLMGNVRLPLESNDMLLYVDPERAPQAHPSVTLAASESKPSPERAKPHFPPELRRKEPEIENGKPVSSPADNSEPVAPPTLPAPRNASGCKSSVSPKVVEKFTEMVGYAAEWGCHSVAEMVALAREKMGQRWRDDYEPLIRDIWAKTYGSVDAEIPREEPSGPTITSEPQQPTATEEHVTVEASKNRIAEFEAELDKLAEERARQVIRKIETEVRAQPADNQGISETARQSVEEPYVATEAAALPRNAAKPEEPVAATMTVSEACYIVFDIIAPLLAGGRCGHLYYPVSALKGYDLVEICIAFKLLVANEFLAYANRDVFDEKLAEEKFSAGVKCYENGLSHVVIISPFVADDQVDVLTAKQAFDVHDSRVLAQETASSFAEYCRGVGADNPNYWRTIYTRLGLEYTSSSPRGNKPVKPTSDVFLRGLRSVELEVKMNDQEKTVDPALRIATVALVLLAAAVLIGASGKHPYSYFTVLRWLVCSAAVGLVCRGTVQGVKWAWAIVPLAILFNPVAPIHSSRETWLVLDIVSASVMVLAVILMEIALLPRRWRKEPCK